MLSLSTLMKVSAPAGMGAGAAFGAGFAVIGVTGFTVVVAGSVFVVSFCVVAFCAIAVAPASANTAAAARKELRIALLPDGQVGLSVNSKLGAMFPGSAEATFTLVLGLVFVATIEAGAAE